MKLGRRRPVTPAKCALWDYFFPPKDPTTALPPPPATCDYSKGASSVLSNVFLNDQLGCCVIAGAYHVIGMETADAEDPFVATDAQILADYQKIGGYVPGNENTDNGCDEITALNYWMKNGFADGTKLAGYVTVDATNQEQVKQAMFLFENLYFGLELPDAWVQPFPSSSGFVWDTGTPDQQNGHCIMGVGYNDVGIQVDSWGLIGTVTWAAVAALAIPSAGGQLYALVSEDQLSKATGLAPNSFDWPQLQADFAVLSAK